MSNLTRHGERADLIAHDVDPANFAALERGRRRHGYPETVAARVPGAPEKRLVVDPQTHGPRDRNPGMASAFRRGGHRMRLGRRVNKRRGTVPVTHVHVP